MATLRSGGGDGMDGAEILHPNVLTNAGMLTFLQDIVRPEAVAFCLFVMYTSMWTFEAVLHWVRHRLHHHRHLLMLLNRTTEELMIMGLTSLIIFVLQLTANNLYLLEKLTFEMLHMTLFLSVTLFICFMMVVVAACRLITMKRWHEIECSLHTAEAGVKLKSDAELFLALRRHFVSWNNLPDNFLFHVYMKDCLFTLIKEVIEFDAKMWLVAYIFILPLCVDPQFMYLIYGVVLLGFAWVIIRVFRTQRQLRHVMENVSPDSVEGEDDWYFFQEQPTSAFSICWELQNKQMVAEAEALFWRGCPRLIRWILHLLLLFTAITVAITLVFFRGTLPPYAIVLAFVGGLLLVIGTAVFVLPVLAQTMAIGRMTNDTLLRRCVKGVKHDTAQQQQQQQMRPRGFTEAILRAQLPKPGMEHPRRISQDGIARPRSVNLGRKSGNGRDLEMCSDPRHQSVIKSVLSHINEEGGVEEEDTSSAPMKQSKTARLSGALGKLKSMSIDMGRKNSQGLPLATSIAEDAHDAASCSSGNGHGHAHQHSDNPSAPHVMVSPSAIPAAAASSPTSPAISPAALLSGGGRIKDNKKKEQTARLIPKAVPENVAVGAGTRHSPRAHDHNVYDDDCGGEESDDDDDDGDMDVPPPPSRDPPPRHGGHGAHHSSEDDDEEDDDDAIPPPPQSLPNTWGFDPQSQMT